MDVDVDGTGGASDSIGVAAPEGVACGGEETVGVSGLLMRLS